jgi:hypothetical protein
MRAKGLKVEARTRTISLLYSSSKKDGRISQIPSQFNDDTRFILSNNVGMTTAFSGHTLMRKSPLSEKSSMAARIAVGLFLRVGRDGELRMASRRFCSRPSWDCLSQAGLKNMG